jgi:6-phosphogluconate dehydrogenase
VGGKQTRRGELISLNPGQSGFERALFSKEELNIRGVEMARFGIVGLETMGVGLCANAVTKGYEVVGFNRSASKTRAAAKYLSGTAFTPTTSAGEFVAELKEEHPPIVMMLVKAGEATWDVFEHLALYLPQGTVVLDMANEHPDDTARFEKMAWEKGIRWLGVGISGGRKGAEGVNKHKGPAVMAGGDEATYIFKSPKPDNLVFEGGTP